jgi:hypothetical protein
MQPLTKNEELEQLCAELRNPYERDFATFDRAAEEIEWLAYELRIANLALEDCSNECNRCYELSDKFEARQKKEIERLEEEVRKAKG